jgi:hypothetical protein
VSTKSETYWQTGAKDAAMQDEHRFMWRGMLDTIDADLGGKRVLDAGVQPGRVPAFAVQRTQDRGRVRV